MNFRKALLVVVGLMSAFSISAFASEAAGAASGDQFASLSAALAIGLAAFGGSLGQARVASAALEGIGRNPAAGPKLFVPMVIGLALIESLVLYAFVIAFIKIKI